MTEYPLHVKVALALGWKWVKHTENANSSHPGARYLIDPDRELEYWWEPATGDEPLAVVDRNLAGEDPRVWLRSVPRYDTDWSATGPLIERFGIALRPPTEPERVTGFWEAYGWIYPEHWDGKTYHDVEEITAGSGKGPLISVCQLILKLAAAGKLPR